MRMVKTPQWPGPRFKALIDRILDETGLNKAQFAALVGINPSQVSRWTNGSTRPKFDTLLALGAAIRQQYPHLDIGPSELTAAAGYSADDPEREHPAEPPRPGLPPHLDHIEDPTPKEAAMLQYLAAMQEEIRALGQKVDAMAEREREREGLENGASEQKGA